MSENFIDHSEFEFTLLRSLAEQTVEVLRSPEVSRDAAVVIVLEAFVDVRRKARSDLMARVEERLQSVLDRE